MSQTVYNYDPRTRIYTGASQADESPLEPGVYLIPAHATTIELPTVAEGKVARWRVDDRMWEVIPDVRGTWYDTDGQPVEASALDADVSQLTREAPPDVPEGKLLSRNVVAALWELIDDVRGTWYDADGRAVQIDDLDADVFGLTREAPPDATYKLVNGKWEQCPDKVAAAKKADMDAEVAAGMAEANLKIAVLQDAVDLDMATPEEEAALKNWRRYRVLLSRAQSDAKYPNVTLPQRPDGGTA